MVLSKFAAVSVMLSVGVLTAASRSASNTAVVAGGDKVTICHFPGHNGDYQIIGLVTGIDGLSCAAEGGNEITIAPEAAVNGHRVKLFVPRS
jgi:hypothetical protein